MDMEMEKFKYYPAMQWTLKSLRLREDKKVKCTRRKMMSLMSDYNYIIKNINRLDKKASEILFQLLMKEFLSRVQKHFDNLLTSEEMIGLVCYVKTRYKQEVRELLGMKSKREEYIKKQLQKGDGVSA